MQTYEDTIILESHFILVMVRPCNHIPASNGQSTSIRNINSSFRGPSGAATANKKNMQAIMLAAIPILVLFLKALELKVKMKIPAIYPNIRKRTMKVASIRIVFVEEVVVVIS